MAAAPAQIEAVEPTAESTTVDQHTEQAQSAAVGAASLCQRCGQPCLTCCPPIVTETPRRPAHRPVGTGLYTTAELRPLVLITAEQLWRKGELPTLKLVAFKIGYSNRSGDSLSRSLVRHGLSWPAIRHDAYRRAYGRLMSGEAA